MTVAPASDRFRRQLRAFPMPADLRGETPRVTDVRLSMQSARTGVASWTMVDSRTRTHVAVALESRDGRWMATQLHDD